MIDTTDEETSIDPEEFQPEWFWPELQIRSLPAATLLNVEVSQEPATNIDSDR